ncbi:hypothetical protein K2173_019912 [Erythroxylum novogranatense]|uniref:HTH myb-type domain-containing protein n=1 Tax=Erythroxylum novogranatense TaxID=1862640 RepID=A0AAV8U9D6_9ROSI|nr:hypothetical protein K2173_019912 [Erythroxylum novogranatense]
MDPGSLELSLSLKPSFVLQDVSKFDNIPARLLMLDEYLHKHQQEPSSFEALKLELPQCMLLLVDAIDKLKEEIMNIKNGVESDYKKESLMQFLSMKTRSYELMQMDAFKIYCKEERSVFMRPSHHQLSKHHQTIKLDKSTIQPLKVGGEAVRNQSKLPSNSKCRNQRRSWSPLLHARFVEAVESLGGPQVATPKQIRAILQVEGLTNDQVKSHLQKYRIHNRKSSTTNDYAFGPEEKFGKFMN